MKRAKDNKLEYISSSPIGGASGHWITPHPAVHVSPAPCAALPIAALSHDDGGELTGDGRRLSRGLTNSRPFAPQIRMFTSDAQQQMQYLTPSPHSTTPSPGQAQYHPQPSQVGGGPSQPFPQAAGQQQFPIMPMIMPQPMVGQFHPNAQQPQYSNQFILMQPHNPAQ